MAFSLRICLVIGLAAAGLWGCEAGPGPSHDAESVDGWAVSDVAPRSEEDTAHIVDIGDAMDADGPSPVDDAASATGDDDVSPEPPWVCPPAVVCVDALPFLHAADTGLDGQSQLDGYSCAPETDESGPEVVYRVEVFTAGFLSAAVHDGAGVDVDVHILSDLDAGSCLARGHHDAAVDVEPGVFWVVVDTWSDGVAPLVGAYTVEIGLAAPSVGPCTMVVGEMPRVGDGGEHLAMPATGPMVMEAHLVTQAEPEPYPASATDELEEHYALSQAATGFVMHRDQVWAPLEGGSFHGCGIGSPSLFPVVDEAWYVNMYWTSSARPDRGTRMLLRLPDTDRAVVVAAGYETGPGNLSNIGGAPEEPHFYLGTGHLSTLTLGVATDQTLPFGPRRCTD